MNDLQKTILERMVTHINFIEKESKGADILLIYFKLFTFTLVTNGIIENDTSKLISLLHTNNSTFNKAVKVLKKYSLIDVTEQHLIIKEANSLLYAIENHQFKKNNSANSGQIKDYFGRAILNYAKIRVEINRNYSDKDKTEFLPNVNITYAEFDYLSRHIEDYILNNYITKVQQYTKCNKPFNTILRWAYTDGNLYFYDITQGGEGSD